MIQMIQNEMWAIFASVQLIPNRWLDFSRMAGSLKHCPRFLEVVLYAITNGSFILLQARQLRKCISRSLSLVILPQQAMVVRMLLSTQGVGILVPFTRTVDIGVVSDLTSITVYNPYLNNGPQVTDRQYR